MNKIIEEKKKGNSLEPFSVYNQGIELVAATAEPPKEPGLNDSPDKRHVRITSKKKKAVTGLNSKAYKSIDRANQAFDSMNLKDNKDSKEHKDSSEPRDKATIDPVSHKIFLNEDSPTPKKKNVHRYLESKGEARVKLPTLVNTMSQQQK